MPGYRAASGLRICQYTVALHTHYPVMLPALLSGAPVDLEPRELAPGPVGQRSLYLVNQVPWWLLSRAIEPVKAVRWGRWSKPHNRPGPGASCRRRTSALMPGRSRMKVARWTRRSVAGGYPRRPRRLQSWRRSGSLVASTLPRTADSSAIPGARCATPLAGDVLGFSRIGGCGSSLQLSSPYS